MRANALRDLLTLWAFFAATSLRVSRVQAEAFFDLCGGLAMTDSDRVSAKVQPVGIFGSGPFQTFGRRVDFKESFTVGGRLAIG